MSESMDITAVQRVVTEMEPEEVAARYGQQMDGEAKIWFQSYLATCQRLESLGSDLEKLMPPMPTGEAVAPVTPFPQVRSRRIPWSMMLSAAAMFILGLMIPPPWQTNAVEPLPSGSAPSSITRSGNSLTPQQDGRIADAFVERAMQFQGQGAHALAWDDYQKALEYLPTTEKHQWENILSEMEILAESMKDPNRQKLLEHLRGTLNQDR